MKSQKIDYSQFKELHKHQGSKNYEVVEIFDTKFEIRGKVLIDTQNKNILVNAFKVQKLEDLDIYQNKRITNLGNEIDVLDNSYRTLKDGTIWGSSFYINFNINGDSTRQKYLDPFSNQEIEDPYEFKTKEQDPEKWMQKFKELYTKAQYIYLGSGFHYFKIEKKWYLMDDNLVGLPDDLKQQYPAKEDQDVRMVALEDMSPTYYVPPNERDTQLIREMDYVETLYKKENWGLIDVGYSAGWWYLEIYMPLGDTLKIKRYASFESPDIQLYKIPDAYGGRQDVLFIVQELKDMHMAQVGGMYAIRPKDPEQPQRRYKSIVYNKNENGEKVIDLDSSEETEEYKAWNAKKK